MKSFLEDRDGFAGSRHRLARIGRFRILAAPTLALRLDLIRNYE
jgi:hypothetical protein